MAEARRVVRPSGVLGIVGDLRSTGVALVWQETARAKLANVLLRRCETHAEH